MAAVNLRTLMTLSFFFSECYSSNLGALIFGGLSNEPAAEHGKWRFCHKGLTVRCARTAFYSLCHYGKLSQLFCEMVSSQFHVKKNYQKIQTFRALAVSISVQRLTSNVYTRIDFLSLWSAVLDQPENANESRRLFLSTASNSGQYWRRQPNKSSKM